MKHFESFLAPQLNEFIAYRKNLGYSTKTLRAHLLCFDRYVNDKNIKPGVLQPSFLLEFRDTLKMEPKTINGVLSGVRVFFDFLVRKDDYLSNPLKDIPSLSERSLAPFIFSPEQTDQLIGATCKRIRKQSKYYLKDLSGYIAIVLLARCGLRIKEPLRLQLHHYRSREKTIYIEKTKFNKDRLTPVPKSVAAELDNFLAVRTALMDEVHHTYLLVGDRERKLNDPRVRSVFHQSVHDIGIDCPRQVIGHMVFASPTPHSLRHSFAVNTLKRVKERGASPQHALPVLATYMGHYLYHYTAKYLKFIDAEQRQSLFDFVRFKKEDL